MQRWRAIVPPPVVSVYNASGTYWHHFISSSFNNSAAQIIRKTLEIQNGKATFTLGEISNLKSLFRNTSVTQIDLGTSITSLVTNMNSLCEGCSALQSMNLVFCDTSSVTTMQSMFKDCSNLAQLDLSGLDTSSVTDMQSMFKNCSKLTQIDLSGLDTSSVTDMWLLFSGCKSLTSVLCPKPLDVQNCEDFASMFDDCPEFDSPIHFKNVKYIEIAAGSSPDDWEITNIGGTRGVHYVVDSVQS